MIREDIYTIGRKKMHAQMVGEEMSITLAKGETEVGDGNFSKYYDVFFGKDDRGRMYMVLATHEWGRGEYHGPYKSCGHWHSGGHTTYIRQYHIKLRKNFTDKDEANRYYSIVKNNMFERTVKDDKKFTEAQIDRLFA